MKDRDLGAEHRMARAKLRILRRLAVMAALVAGARGQFEEEEEQFRGQLIGSLNSYHHQVMLSLLRFEDLGFI